MVRLAIADPLGPASNSHGALVNSPPASDAGYNPSQIDKIISVIILVDFIMTISDRNILDGTPGAEQIP